MRNLVLVLVALLAVPAFAAPALQLVNLGSNSVALDFTTSGSLVSGMGLKITASDGAVFSAYADGAQGTKYWVHPSNILIDGLGNLTSKGSAVASNDANGLKLEYGALYVRSNPSDPNKPATGGRLCTFTVSKPCTVTVVSDYAGGVVTEDFNSFTALTASVVIPPVVTECYKTTSPDYAAWVAFGKPDCWCFQRNCRGDINGVKSGLYWVASTDLTLLKAAYTKSDTALLAITNGICADLDRAKPGLYRVSSSDLTILKQYYTKSDSLVPVCDVALVNFWKN